MLKQTGIPVMPEPYLVQAEDIALGKVKFASTGSGVETYELYVNGQYHSEIKVDFIPYG